MKKDNTYFFDLEHLLIDRYLSEKSDKKIQKNVLYKNFKINYILNDIVKKTFNNFENYTLQKLQSCRQTITHEMCLKLLKDKGGDFSIGFLIEKR